MGRVARGADRTVAALLVVALRGWRLLVSPLYGQTCRFHPTCSAYALEAVQVHGALRGSWLAVRRLGRCHPWNPGGVDLVPPATPKAGSAERGVGDPDPRTAGPAVHPLSTPGGRRAA